MLSTAIIVFREVLEAALLIGILAAATRNVAGKNSWIAAGLLTGLLASGLVAAGASTIGSMASGMGQELFNASILGIAVLMLAWHNIWMSSHGAELAGQAKNLGREISSGKRERSVILVLVAIAVLREGSETVLFLYGIAASESTSAHQMLAGGLAGIIAGILVGVTLYAGLLRIPMKWFFAATSILVLLLAAGMAAQAARYLIQADLLPSLISPIWDTSATIPEQSFLGITLRSLIGYDSQPTGMQLAVFTGTLVSIGIGMQLNNHPSRNRTK